MWSLAVFDGNGMHSIFGKQKFLNAYILTVVQKCTVTVHAVSVWHRTDRRHRKLGKYVSVLALDNTHVRIGQMRCRQWCQKWAIMCVHTVASWRSVPRKGWPRFIFIHGFLQFVCTTGFGDGPFIKYWVSDIVSKLCRKSVKISEQNGYMHG